MDTTEIVVDKLCRIAQTELRGQYILDIIAIEDINDGFINFQVSVNTQQDCCESNSLEDIDWGWSEEPVDERLKSRWYLNETHKLSLIHI